MDPEHTEERFRALFAAHYGALVRFAARRVGADEAGDVVASTFLVAWRRLAQIPPDRPLPWLYATAKHVIADERRAGARRERLAARAAAQPGPDGSDPSGPVTERLRVRAVLAGLSAGDQEILRLTQWERLTVAEAAAVLGCSVTAAKVRLHRAQRRFAARLLASDGAASPAPAPATTLTSTSERSFVR